MCVAGPRPGSLLAESARGTQCGLQVVHQQVQQSLVAGIMLLTVYSALCRWNWPHASLRVLPTGNFPELPLLSRRRESALPFPASICLVSKLRLVNLWA